MFAIISRSTGIAFSSLAFLEGERKCAAGYRGSRALDFRLVCPRLYRAFAAISCVHLPPSRGRWLGAGRTGRSTRRRILSVCDAFY